MTVIAKDVFANLTGANEALINDVMRVLNDPRFTLAEPLRQLLAQGKYVLRLAQPEDGLGKNDGGTFIDPKTVNGVTIPGQIVIKADYVSKNGLLAPISLVELLIHEGWGHGNEAQIAKRAAALAQLANVGSGTPTDRGDLYVRSWLDDESYSRYQSYLALKQIAGIGLLSAGAIDSVIKNNEVFAEFARLEPLAAARNLSGDAKDTFVIEGARSIMSRYNNGIYVENGTSTVLGQMGYAVGMPEALAMQAYMKRTYNGVRFTSSNLVMHDDGSFSGTVVFENGIKMDSVFDAAGNLFRRVQTIPGNANTGRATIIATYSPGAIEPDRIEVQETDASGRVSSTYTQDAEGNWKPTSWTQDGQTYTGDDLGTFIANLENASNASDASASQGNTAGRLNQLLAGASGDNVAGVAAARDTGLSLDTLGNRLGMPYVSDRWAPAFLSGQMSSQLLLLNTAGALTNQGLGQIAQSRINQLRTQPSIFTVTVISVGGGFSLPLVLDLDDDGLGLVSMDRSNASFDANMTGNAKTIGWVGPRDGILVLDKNGNGIVDDAGEWFGQKFATSGIPPANQDGFKALATLANAGATTFSGATSRINAATGKLYFNELQVWIDVNQDGKTDSGELRSLDSLGITSIDLTSQAVNRDMNGNKVLSQAGYTTADGKRHAVSDVGLSTELPILKDGPRPGSAAALAFAEYASKGYAAIATGQARAIAASVQGLPAIEQGAISALQQKFTLPVGTGPFSPAALEARAKMTWAVQAGLGQTGLNDKITYFFGPDGDRTAIPAAWRRVNTAPTEIISVLNGIISLKAGEASVAQAIESATMKQSDAQTKAQLANATQSAAARADAWLGGYTTGIAWNSAIMGYLSIKDQLDGLAARLPAIQVKLNEVVPQNLNLQGHLAGAGTFLTRNDTAMAAEAFRSYSTALQSMAALKVTGDQLLGSIAQSNGYTRVYVGQNGQTTSVENGYNLLLGNSGAQTFVLNAGVDNIAVTGTTGSITVVGFQAGAGGDQIQFLAGGFSAESVIISSDGQGNTLLSQYQKTIKLLGVDPSKLDLYANLAGAYRVTFTNTSSSVRSLRGEAVYDGLTHVDSLIASNYGDTLIGGDRGSQLVGGTGNDTFVITGRRTSVDGGGGSDAVTYRELDMGIEVQWAEVINHYDDGQPIMDYYFTDGLGSRISEVQNIQGTKFNDQIAGNDYANVLDGGRGNDSLAGGRGSDTYVFALGDGRDSIEEVANVANEIDTISFAVGVKPEDIKATRNGQDLVLSYSANDSIRIVGWFASAARGIERISFAGGATWDVARIISILDAPTVMHPLAAQSATEDTAWTFVIPADVFLAKDGGPLNLSVSLDNGGALPSWLRFDPLTRTLSGTPLNANVGSLNLKVTATDPRAGGNVSTPLVLGIANTNDAPVAGISPVPQSVSQGNQWTYALPAAMFSDEDVGDRLTYRATLSNGNALPSWLTFDAATRTLSGKASIGDLGALDLKIIATDLSGASASNALRIVVTAPVAGQTITGTAGNDVLVGTAGNDIIDGGWGRDTMTGGDGDDTYYVDTAGDIVIEQLNGGVDTVILTLFQGLYTLPENVENLKTVFQSGGDDVVTIRGNALDNILEVDAKSAGYRWTIELFGGAGNDTLRVRNNWGSRLDGGDGDDILDGAVNGEPDWLKGGAGSDTFLFGRGSGHDTIEQDGDLSGETDTIQFGAGVTFDQLWFRKNGQLLEVRIIGTDDLIAMRQEDIESFRTSDGKVLLDSQVQNLVQAMSAFSPPAAGQTTLPPNYQNALAPVLVANWQ